MREKESNTYLKGWKKTQILKLAQKEHNEKRKPNEIIDFIRKCSHYFISENSMVTLRKAYLKTVRQLSICYREIINAFCHFR